MATAAAAVDLAYKALAAPVALHDRPATWIVVFGALALVEAAAIALTGSRALAVAGGLLVGGSASNLASAAIWGGVPDPIALGGVYLNAADLLIAAGIALLLPATAIFAARNRRLLRGRIPGRLET